MAEWLKAHAWKACLLERVTWVRIPLSPPCFQNHSQTCGFRDPVTIVHAVALAACSHCAYYQDVEIVGSDVNERLGAA
jgi:hypothetical protein